MSQILGAGGGGAIPVPLPVNQGGTGLTTITDHAVMVGSGINPVTPVGPGTDGQLLIGSTGADPAWAALTSSGSTITITGGAGTLNIDTAAAVPTSFACDAGSAVPAAGVLTVAGGNDISTSGAGSTVTIDITGATQYGVQVGDATGGIASLAVGTTNEVLLGSTGANPYWGAVDLTTSVTGILPVANGGTGLATITDHGVMVGSGVGAVTPLAVGTDGQVLIGATGADPAFATITSTGSTITFTPGANTLNMETGGAIAASFPTDSGTATPAAGALTIAGGNDIATSGAGSTVTVSLSGTTQYGLQVGDASGGIASLAIGTANQILQSAGAGSNPAWSTATYPATTAQGDVLYSSSANTVAGLTKNATATRYIANTGASNNPAWDQVNLANGVTGTLPVGNGGSGATTFTDHGVLLGSGAGAFSVTAVGATGTVLKGNTGADPTFGAVDLTSDITGILPVANGGTGLSTITDHGIMVGSGAGNVTPLAVGATGETVMGSTGADPTWTGSPSFSGSVTAGTGFTATTGDVTISAGNLNLPTTNAALTEGVIEINSVRVMHAFGTRNFFFGTGAGNGTLSGVANAGIGDSALDALTSGVSNTALGDSAGSSITEGNKNVCMGQNSCPGVTTGSYNVGIGATALGIITTGNYNIGIGEQSGSSLTTSDSDNICISNPGTSGDNNTIRIGTQGTGDKQQDTTFIAGIYNTTPAGGNDGNVIIDSNGQLGTIAAYPIVWSEVTGTSQSASVNSGYIANNVALVTVTLPDTAAVGSVVEVVGKGAGKFKIGQNAGETVHFGGSSTTTGAGGSLTADLQYGAIKLVCITANTDWVVTASSGNFTIV